MALSKLAEAFSGHGSVRRWCHEFGPNRIAYFSRQDAIDFRFCPVIEAPAADGIDGPQLVRIARAPKSGGDALIEYPAHGELNDAPAETRPGKPVEFLHCRQILRKARHLELGLPRIVTV